MNYSSVAEAVLVDPGLYDKGPEEIGHSLHARENKGSLLSCADVFITKFPQMAYLSESQRRFGHEKKKKNISAL